MGADTRGEVAVSIIGSASAVAKVQANVLTLELSYGVNGKIGASANLTTGISLNNQGDIKKAASLGGVIQLPYFVVAEGKFSYDVEDADYEAIVGGGIGASLNDHMYTGEYEYTDTISISFNFVSPRTLMYYQEWYYHLGGK